MTVQNNPPATATASRAWTTTPIEWLPILDLQLIVEFYRKIECKALKIELTTARGYLRALQKFDGVLEACAPHMLALPLAARLTAHHIQLFVSARSEVTTAAAVHRDLQTLIEALSFLDRGADLTALRKAQQDLYIPRKQRKIVVRRRLSPTKEEFEKQFPKLAAGLDAEKAGARVEKLSEKSRGIAVDELRAYIHALCERNRSLVVDDAKALFTPEKLDIYIEDLQRRGEDRVIRALQRLRGAIRRIDSSDRYDWVDERIKMLGPQDQEVTQPGRLSAVMTPEDGEEIAAYLDDDTVAALDKEWSGWSDSTKKNVRDAFVYCLGSLQRIAPELAAKPISERFPPYAIDGIIEDQVKTCSSATIALRLSYLKQLLDRADPHTNHNWILARASDLSNAHPHERKTKKYTPILEVVRQAFALMNDCLLRFEILENLKDVASIRSVAEKYRDGLVLAFLCFLAPRARALAEMRLGKTLKRDEAGFLYHVVGKNGLPDIKRVPQVLEPYIEFYINKVRHLIDPNAAPDVFWTSTQRGPLTRDAIGRIAPNLSEEILAVRIGTHPMRSNVATDASKFVTVDPFLASKLLHHLDPRVTESVYILTALNSAQALLAGLVGEAMRLHYNENVCA